MSIKDSPVFDRPRREELSIWPPAAIPLMLALQEGRERNPCRLGLFGQAGAAISALFPKGCQARREKGGIPTVYKL